MNSLRIISTVPESSDAAAVADALNISINCDQEESKYSLIFSENGVELTSHKSLRQSPIRVDFHTGSSNHRRLHGGGKGQMIAKAVGITSQYKPSVLDATSGLGGDAFVLASLGCKVTMQERSPIAYALLKSGLKSSQRYAKEHNQELSEILLRMTLTPNDSTLTLDDKHDVIYLDPMFPLRKKSALANKEMRAFHDLIGSDSDADKLLENALKRDICRIVVKRPRIAPHLLNQKPSYQLEGKSSRFDIYTKKKLPSV